MKRFELYAGVNGAGKTTLYQIQNTKTLPRVNTDEIVVELGLDWRSPEAQRRAGKISIEKIQNYIREGISFNQETTLAGRTIKKQIKEMKKQGYQIYLYYVGVSEPKIAIERVKYRVTQGGHGIPEEDIYRRYERSLQNLIEIVPFCDRIEIYDNSNYYHLAYLKDKKGAVVQSNQTFLWIKNVMNQLENISIL